PTPIHRYLVMIPDRGQALALADLLAGQVHVIFPNIVVVGSNPIESHSGEVEFVNEGIDRPNRDCSDRSNPPGIREITSPVRSIPSTKRLIRSLRKSRRNHTARIT